nr:MAG TPA: hypothetical protein [Caudoviricetes sp.]
MPGHNSNHFTGKTKSGDPRKNRKKKSGSREFTATSTNHST